MSVELIPHLMDATSATAQVPLGQRGLYVHWRNGSLCLNDDAFRVLKQKA